MRLQRNSPIPLYQQLLNSIRERIATGVWPVGSQVPTEAELVAELGVSRVTIRQALSAAVDAGLVQRTPGKGTFVADSRSGSPRRGFIGYVAEFLGHDFNVQTLRGFESVVKKHGYQLIFSNSEGRLAEEDRLLQNLEADGVVGYAVEPHSATTRERVLARLVSAGARVVLIDRMPPGIAADLVAADHVTGGYDVVTHLITQGYTDILYLARAPLAVSSITERFHGYQAALAAAGLVARAPVVVEGPADLGNFRRAYNNSEPERTFVNDIAAVLRSSERPQAVVAMNDLLALALYAAAQQVGLRIPDDLAVVGFDDLDLAAALAPPLTTVAQDPFRIGVEAALLLLARIGGEASSIRQIRLPTRLVIRQSSNPPAVGGGTASVQPALTVG